MQQNWAWRCFGGSVLNWSALALVDVLGVFTSEIGFRTPKIQRSDVL